MDKNNIMAGAENMPSGGYSLGNREDYEAFLDQRLQSVRDTIVSDMYARSVANAGNLNQFNTKNIDVAKAFYDMLLKEVIDMIDPKTGEKRFCDQTEEEFWKNQIVYSIKSRFGVK